MAKIKLYQGGQYVGNFSTTQQNDDTIDFPATDGYLLKTDVESSVTPYITLGLSSYYTKNEINDTFVPNNAFDPIQQKVAANTDAIGQIVENIRLQEAAATNMTGVFENYASKTYVDNKTTGFIRTGEDGKIPKTAIPGIPISGIIDLQNALNDKATQEQVSGFNTLKTQVEEVKTQVEEGLIPRVIDLESFKNQYPQNINDKIDEKIPAIWRASFIKTKDGNIMSFENLLTAAVKNSDTNTILKKELGINTVVSDGINSGITINADGSINYDQTFEKAVKHVTEKTINNVINDSLSDDGNATIEQTIRNEVSEQLKTKLAALKVYERLFNDLKDTTIIGNILENDSLLEGVYNIAKYIILMGVSGIDSDGNFKFYSTFEEAKNALKNK